jgi:hypothetical protein
MRSRAARLTFCVVAWAALAAAGFFLIQAETQISQRREAFRAFDQHAREATDALADMRAAQHAYLAAGQGVAFWMPKVAALLGDVARDVDRLRASAASGEAGASLIEAAANITEFTNVDRRARDYLQSGQTLMAGDVVFTEGGETAALAARQVESARLAERRTLDASEAAVRRQEAIVLGAAAGLGALVMAMLAFAAPGKARVEATANAGASRTEASPEPRSDLVLRDPVPPPKAPTKTTADPAPQEITPIPSAPAGAKGGLPRGSVPLLKAAADLCTELSRVNDAGELQRLLARAADIMDASGLVVWIGSPAGADLRPALTHGYPDQVLARMQTVPRSASNAAAAAYRTGALQIVLKRPGSNGAVVAPLLSPEGCVGAFSAEILSGSETADCVQALAAIFAAQFAVVLAGPASATETPAADPATARIASGSSLSR